MSGAGGDVLVDFAERQADRRARGLIGQAAIMDTLESDSPSLRAYAEWIVGAPVALDELDIRDPATAIATLRDAIGALKMLNARRELDRLRELLGDDPEAALSEVLRTRVVEVAGLVRELERSGVVRTRPWAQILGREANPPARRPIVFRRRLQ